MLCNANVTGNFIFAVESDRSSFSIDDDADRSPQLIICQVQIVKPILRLPTFCEDFVTTTTVNIAVTFAAGAVHWHSANNELAEPLVVVDAREMALNKKRANADGAQWDDLGWAWGKKRSDPVSIFTFQLISTTLGSLRSHICHAEHQTSFPWFQ
jgi:hypothetical protein